MSLLRIKIREAKEDDLDQIGTLFYETVTAINSRDYNPEQIKVWSQRETGFWNTRFKEQSFFVAEYNNQIVGFASITNSGYLDFMYIHKSHQRKGIARDLLHVIEQHCLLLELSQIHTHASITARAFFENAGFVLMRGPQKQAKIGDVLFVNYAMKKELR